jgi:hypothetical protein
MSDSILVATPCVSERTRTTLDFFFQKHCQNRFKISDASVADMYILDLDVIGGMLILETLQKNNPLQPVVALTVRDENIDGVQIMRKPIDLDVLKRAFDFYYEEHQRNKLRDTAESDSEKEKPVPSTQSTRLETRQLEKNRLSASEPSGLESKPPLDIDLGKIKSEAVGTVDDSTSESAAQPASAKPIVQTRSTGISALFGGYVDPEASNLPDKPNIVEDQQVAGDDQKLQQWAINTIDISLVKESADFAKLRDEQQSDNQNPPQDLAKTNDRDQSEAQPQQKLDNKSEKASTQAKQGTDDSAQKGSEKLRPDSDEKKVSSMEATPSSVDVDVPGEESQEAANQVLASSDLEKGVEPVPPEQVSETKPVTETDIPENTASDQEQMEAEQSSSDIQDPVAAQVSPLAQTQQQVSGAGSRSIADLGRIVREYCGNRDDLDLSSPEQREQLYYKLKGSLLSHVQSFVGLANDRQRPVSVMLEPDKRIVILPVERRILTTIKEQILRARTRLTIEIDEEELNIEVHDDLVEAEFLEGDYLSNEPIEAFLWKIALWTSYGRVVTGTNLDTWVRLMQWPNFTRLVTIPQFMRIASYWSKEGASLLQTASALGLPQRYVFSFFSACQVLQLVELTSKPATVETNDPESNVPAETNKRRGLFSRLINHLRNPN